MQTDEDLEFGEPVCGIRRCEKAQDHRDRHYNSQRREWWANTAIPTGRPRPRRGHPVV